jgi:hypothetical protein
MKTKILLSFAVLFFIAIASNAQVDKGKVLLGGGAGYSSYKNPEPGSYNGSEYKAANFNIQFGKVVNTNSVVGIILSYGYSKFNATNFPDSNLNKNNQYGAGVFYRKYKKLLKDFYFFGEADGEYMHSVNTQHYFQNGDDGSKEISNGGVISFVPGLSYQLCKKMQIELTMVNIVSVSYSHTKTVYNANNNNITPGSYNGNNFGFDANLNSNLLSNFGIGFKFLLGK